MKQENGQSSTLAQRMEGVYKVLGELQALNWKIRFGGAGFMGMASQEVIDTFVQMYGPLESVGVHTWLVGVADYLIRRNCPALDCILDKGTINEIILFHDIREFKIGDTSALVQETEGGNLNHETEREHLLELLKSLEPEIADPLFTICESYELDDHENQSLEVLYVRLIEEFQAGSCVIKYCNNLSGYSDQLAPIVRKRIGLKAKRLLDKIHSTGDHDLPMGDDYDVAAAEVDELVKFHLCKLRGAGLTVDLSEFGF